MEEILNVVFNVIDQVVNFGTAQSIGYAKYLFNSFLAIAIVLYGLKIAYEGLDYLGSLVKVVSIGFIFYFVSEWLTIVNILTTEVLDFGSQLSGVGFGDSPTRMLTGLIESGVDIFKAIYNNLKKGAAFSPDFVILAFVSLIFSVGIVIGYALIVAAVLVIIIEVKVASVFAVMLIPFGLLNRFNYLFEKVVAYLINSVIKFAVMGFILGFIYQSNAQLASLLTVDTSITNLVAIVILTVIFVMLVLKAPAIATSLVSGSPQLGAGALGGAAGAVAGGTAGVLAGGYLAGKGAMGAAGSASNTFQGAGNLATNGAAAVRAATSAGAMANASGGSMSTAFAAAKQAGGNALHGPNAATQKYAFNKGIATGDASLIENEAPTPASGKDPNKRNKPRKSNFSNILNHIDDGGGGDSGGPDFSDPK